MHAFCQKAPHMLPDPNPARFTLLSQRGGAECIHLVIHQWWDELALSTALCEELPTDAGMFPITCSDVSFLLAL